MIRLTLTLAVALAALPGLATAQQVSPPPAVMVGPPPVADEAATARYVEDFARFCLNTGGERAAVRAAVTEAGWVETASPGGTGPAVDMAAWRAPQPDGGVLMTSASPPGDMPQGLIVRSCILQPAGGSAGPPARVQQAAAAAIGLPGRNTGASVAWMVSGTSETGFRDESEAFIAAGNPDAGFALALERPILMVTVITAGDEAGLALLRLSPE